jgi:hypothetical protein
MSNKEPNKDINVAGLANSLQKLSFDQLLQELGKMKLKLGVIIPVIFEKGKQEGHNEIEIRNKIKKIIDVPERTLNPYLPEGAKRHKYPRNRELAKSANYNEITENSSNTNARSKSFNMLNENTRIDIDKNYGKSNSEPASSVISRSTQKSEYVYGHWTLEELVSKYEEAVLENEYIDLQLADANTRIEELEQFLEEQGYTIDD